MKLKRPSSKKLHSETNNTHTQATTDGLTDSHTEHAEKVLIGGDIYLYQVKAPFERSGKSVKGAVEYDEAADKVKCHECGGWFRSIGGHARAKHGLSSRKYKKRHGISGKASLLSEGVRQKIGHKRAANGHGSWLNSPEIMEKRLRKLRSGRKRLSLRSTDWYNKRGLCPAQILQKIRTLAAALGRTPTRDELHANGVSMNTMRFIYGSVTQAVKLAGIEPRSSGVTLRRYSDETLLEMLRIFYRLNGRQPRKTDFGRYGLPCDGVFRYRFGTMKKAWRRAGLPGWKDYPYRSLPFHKETIPLSFARPANASEEAR